MTSEPAPREPPREGDDSLAAEGASQRARPEPLKDEIAKDTPRSFSASSGARFEVRFRRLVLLLVILIPLIWWIAASLA